MTIEELINTIKSQPDSVSFEEVMETIKENYRYTPSRFTNGSGDAQVVNEAGTNEGSCKIFAFGKLNGLNADETLACFGKFYREDVLQNPQATDHANIRTFIKSGWEGINFDQIPLTQNVT